MDTQNLMNAEDSDDKSISIEDILDNSLNVAEILEDDVLDRIAEQVVEDYDIDRETMMPWLTAMEKGIELASQEITRKTEPWPGASNIKHSLILEACIQFTSRALPEFIRDNKVVKSRIYGADDQSEKAQRAKRVEDYMNYDLMEGMPEWEEGFDRQLSVLAMVGTIFKKTYPCPVSGRNKSVLCLPDKITINQATECLENARRITHEIPLYGNEIEARIRAGAFLDVELKADASQEQPDNDQEHIFLEQHRLLDLDGDGYPEPYAVTVHEADRKVVRIAPLFSTENVRMDIEDDGSFKIVSIEKDDYFSDYHFIRSIDGSFFSYGFGYLLSHAAHTINSLLNQLIDAGSLENSQSGFIGKGARIKGGQISFRPGKWVKADASGVDLKNSIVPLPTKGPSPTLFSLVQFLLQSYYRMISMSEIMSGQISGSNTTAAEAMQAVEQGLKVMNAIHRRIYRGLRKELKIMYKLNYDYLSQEKYERVLDVEGVDPRADFEYDQCDIVPIADPSRSSQMEEVMKLRAVAEMKQVFPEMQNIPLGRRLLTAMRIENVDEILPPVDPNQPTPQQIQFAEELERQADALQLQDRELRVKEGELELKAIKLQYEIQKLAADAQLTMSKAQKEGASIELDAFEKQSKRIAAVADYIQAITVDRGETRADSGGSE